MIIKVVDGTTHRIRFDGREGSYGAPEQVPQVRNVRVLLGSYGGVTHPIPAPSPAFDLSLVLGEGETWTFQPLA